MYYEKWKDDAGQWRWHLRAANHEIIAQGESYVNESDCDRVISLVKSSSSAPVHRR
jgi:uncharacterized protein YegP (UPF0339 family)